MMPLKPHDNMSRAERIIPIFIFYALTFVFASNSFGAAIRRISVDLVESDVSAANQNFVNINDELLNVVHKTSTETIHGIKYFVNPVDFGQVTASTITASTI